MGRTITDSGQYAKLILTGDKCRSVFWKLGVLLLWNLKVKRPIVQPTGVTSTWTVAIHVPKPICPKINSCSVWSTGLHSVVWSTEWGIKPQIHPLSSILSAPLSHTHAARQSSPTPSLSTLVDGVWNVKAHAQIPDFVFRRNGRVNLNWWGRRFSRLLAAKVCASAVVMLDTPCSDVVWRVLVTHSIRQCPLHFPTRALRCAFIFQLDSTVRTKHNEATAWLSGGYRRITPPVGGLERPATSRAAEFRAVNGPHTHS